MINNEKIINGWKEQYEKKGYCIHQTIIDKEREIAIDTHTHGLLVSQGLIDYQILLPMPAALPIRIIETLIEQSENHPDWRITDGETHTATIDGNLYVYTVRLTELVNGGLVYRLIFADEYQKYPWDDGVRKEYKVQWNKLDARRNYRLVRQPIEFLESN